MLVRKVEKRDMARWAAMRLKLWPDSGDGYSAELDAYFSGNPIGICEAFVLQNGEKVEGFIELSIRNVVEGSESGEVPYVEAWYVSQDYQGRGFGKQLMDCAERWAIKKGYSELASDADYKNLVSIRAHKNLGFNEVSTVVCFHKNLIQPQE